MTKKGARNDENNLWSGIELRKHRWIQSSCNWDVCISVESNSWDTMDCSSPDSSVHGFTQAGYWSGSVQFSSVTQSGPALCHPMNYSMLGLPVHHQLPEPTQTHVHRVGDAIQPSHPLLSPSPPALNLSQHQGLFKWVSSSHQVAKVLEFQLQHQSFQWITRTDLL